MHGIFWMVIGHSGTCYRDTPPPRFILIFTCIGIPTYVAYFVCDSASEFGAMGSTSFFGVFSYPNLLLVFSEPVIFRNLYHMFFASVGRSLGLFYFILFFCTLFWVSV